MLYVDKSTNFNIPFQMKNKDGGIVDITSATVTCYVKEYPTSSTNAFTKVSTDTAQLEKTSATSGLGVVKVLAANTSSLTKRVYYYEITDTTNKVSGFFTIKQNTGTATDIVTNTLDSSADASLTGAVNGVNTIFNLSKTPLSSGLFMVFVNGVKQTVTTDYVVLNARVTFQAGHIPQTGDLVEVYYVA